MEAQDSTFIEMIYDHYGDALYGIVIRILKEENLSKDVMQEGFVKVWKNYNSYDKEKARLFTWLLQIFRNTAIDHFRRMKKNQGKMIHNEKSSVNDIEYKGFAPELMDVGNFVNNMESKYRKVIQLLYFKGMTQEEVSQKLAIPLGTVKSRLRIGLNHLRKIYGSNFIFVLVCLINLL